jgi:hypothetical protein
MRINQPEIHPTCPACQESLSLGKSCLDPDITCPKPDCGRQLKINLFFTEMAEGI